MIIWTVTVFCIAVKVLVVGVPIFVVDFRMDMAEWICEGNKEGRKKIVETDKTKTVFFI